MGSLDLLPSSIRSAGRGVFTGTAYAVDDPICFYGGTRKRKEDITALEWDYVIGDEEGDGGEASFFVGTQSSRSCGLGCAQFINDGAKPQFDNPPRGLATTLVRWVARLMKQYEHESHAKQNVYTRTCASFTVNGVLMQNVRMFFAARPIAAREELFFSYGSHFWITKAIREVHTERWALSLALAAFEEYSAMSLLSQGLLLRATCAPGTLTYQRMLQIARNSSVHAWEQVVGETDQQFVDSLPLGRSARSSQRVQQSDEQTVGEGGQGDEAVSQPGAP